MDQERFSSFRNDLEQLFVQICMKDEGYKPEIDKHEMKDTRPPKPQKPKQDMAKIIKSSVKRRFRSSKDTQILMNYSGVESDIKKNSPEEIVDSLNLISKAIGNGQKAIIHYSILQGGLLQDLKEASDNQSFNALLKRTQISRAHACLFPCQI